MLQATLLGLLSLRGLVGLTLASAYPPAKGLAELAATFFWVGFVLFIFIPAMEERRQSQKSDVASAGRLKLRHVEWVVGITSIAVLLLAGGGSYIGVLLSAVAAYAILRQHGIQLLSFIAAGAALSIGTGSLILEVPRDLTLLALSVPYLILAVGSRGQESPSGLSLR